MLMGLSMQHFTNISMCGILGIMIIDMEIGRLECVWFIEYIIIILKL